MGFKKIDTASGGNDALVKLKAQNYSVVVSAWVMDVGGGDGSSLLTGIRGLSGGNAAVPFIGIFEKNDPALIKRAIDGGMTYYLVHPADPDTFKKAMVKALGEF